MSRYVHAIVIPVTTVAVRDALILDPSYEVREEMCHIMLSVRVRRKDAGLGVGVEIHGMTTGLNVRACWVAVYRNRQSLHYSYMLSKDRVLAFIHEVLSNDEARLQKALKPYQTKERKKREREAAETAARHARTFPKPKVVADAGPMESWERMELAVRDHSNWKPPKLKQVKMEDA